jgi:hypothetical protein
MSARAVVALTALLGAACSNATGNGAAGAAAEAAASGQKVGGATYIDSSVLQNRMTSATVTDPTLNNMVAFTIPIPEGWKLQGISMMPPCTPAPSPAFRAYSPDGLLQLRQQPLLGWRWAPGGNSSQNGCANLMGVITAADFLKYYLGTLQQGVHVVGPMPVPAAFTQSLQGLARQFEQNDSRMGPMFQLHHSADTAALRVQVINGSFLVEERLRAGVECGVKSASEPTAGGTCFARIDVLSAPIGKLDALVELADANELPHWNPTREWWQATLQQMSERNAREGAARLAQGRAESQAFSNMMNNAFQQSMARSAAQHAAFMQQQESSFQNSMNHAVTAMNARSTAASDWVDYALDQQTVTGAGGTAKVSNAYSQTWSNGQGQWYQTNDPNANPNGVLQGNWTPTVQVHGNGESK